MGPSDNRRVYGDLARQLASGAQLSPEQRQFLAQSLQRVAAGEDANEVLGLKFGRGQSSAAAAGRQTVSFLLHLVAAYVEEGVAVELACKKVSELAQRMPGGGAAYDADYLRNCWYTYPHMQSPDRMLYDPDFPYEV